MPHSQAINWYKFGNSYFYFPSYHLLYWGDYSSDVAQDSEAIYQDRKNPNFYTAKNICQNIFNRAADTGTDLTTSLWCPKSSEEVDWMFDHNPFIHRNFGIWTGVEQKLDATAADEDWYCMDKCNTKQTYFDWSPSEPNDYDHAQWDPNLTYDQSRMENIMNLWGSNPDFGTGRKMNDIWHKWNSLGFACEVNCDVQDENNCPGEAAGCPADFPVEIAGGCWREEHVPKDYPISLIKTYMVYKQNTLDDIEEMVEGIGNHGCWCNYMREDNGMHQGQPIDDLDRSCKDYTKCLKCADCDIKSITTYKAFSRLNDVTGEPEWMCNDDVNDPDYDPCHYSLCQCQLEWAVSNKENLDDAFDNNTWQVGLGEGDCPRGNLGGGSLVCP